MHLIVGLGNLGAEYENNRHNIGFMAVDALARKYEFPTFRDKFKGMVSKGKIEGKAVVLLKPQTYMNLSGDSVLQVATFYKIPPECITVIHDEIDLPTGKIKIKTGGGNAGHNGLKSIDKVLGNNYQRVRIGVSRPQNAQSVSSYVLSDFTSDDIILVNEVIHYITNNISDILATV